MRGRATTRARAVILDLALIRSLFLLKWSATKDWGNVDDEEYTCFASKYSFVLPVS
jgi:hypothetical protein